MKKKFKTNRKRIEQRLENRSMRALVYGLTTKWFMKNGMLRVLNADGSVNSEKDCESLPMEKLIENVMGLYESILRGESGYEAKGFLLRELNRTGCLVNKILSLLELNGDLKKGTDIFDFVGKCGLQVLWMADDEEDCVDDQTIRIAYDVVATNSFFLTF